MDTMQATRIGEQHPHISTFTVRETISAYCGELVENAISLANWFEEQDSALRYLAARGRSSDIRDWADDIAATPDEQHGWPEEFCEEVHDAWDAVADEIDEVIVAIAAESPKWTAADVRSRLREE